MGRKTIRSELPVRFVGAGHFIDVRWIFQWNICVPIAKAQAIIWRDFRCCLYQTR
jgi:hypothetical protein